MGNDHHRELLADKEGWNNWRRLNPAIEPDLSGLAFSKADLTGLNLDDVDFEGADLSGADLTGSSLVGAKLIRCNRQSANFSKCRFVPPFDGTTVDHALVDRRKANFAGSVFEDANFANAELFKADFTAANMSNANFSGAEAQQSTFAGSKLQLADFTSAALSNAVFTDAHLSSAKFVSASLSDASFRGANLRYANLTNSTVRYTDLSGATLTDVIGLHLDSNCIQGARFSPFAGDRWSILRRNYTGFRVAINLVLLLAFFLPQLIGLTIYAGLERADRQISNITDEIHQASRRAHADGEFATAMALERFARNLAQQRPEHVFRVQRLSVLEFILGAHRSFVVGAMSISILLYNVMRGWLTYKVSALREEEERSGYSPDQDNYNLLYIIHLLSRLLLVVAMGSFAVNLYYFLQMPLLVPLD